jgi:hypothetical protein
MPTNLSLLIALNGKTGGYTFHRAKCCPGLGAGGQVDSETSANANSAVYATFAITAFFAG